MPTRISTPQLFEFGQKSIARAREREVKSAEKASTMKGVVRPAEDPSKWLEGASLKDDLSIREAIARNASLAQHSLSATETILTQVQEHTQKAYELAIATSGNDFTGAANRKQALSEIENLFDATVQTLNTRFGNRTLLAGRKTQGNAFDKEGNFVGDGNDFEIEIARGLTVPININGARAIMGEGIADGVNLLQAIKDLARGMREDDPAQCQQTIEQLKKGNEQISLVRAELAGRITQVERSIADFGGASIDLKEAISKIEDADAIQAFSDLARDQAALRASISTTEKILSENPVDILFK